MNYDVRVVAALALAVLALPPVVNAIMYQAAQQADVSWLRDQDLDGEIDPENLPPIQHTPEGTPPPGDQPPPNMPPPPPPPPCTPRPFGEARRVSPQDLNDASVLSLTLEPTDQGIGVSVEGRGVTGTPDFSLSEDGEGEVWSYTPRFHVNEDVQAQFPDSGDDTPSTSAGQTWELRYDLSGVAHQGFQLAIFTLRCEVRPR